MKYLILSILLVLTSVASGQLAEQALFQQYNGTSIDKRWVGGDNTIFGIDAAGNITAFSAIVSGTNTGDQTITLTGDVAGSGTGSFVTTIQPNSVALGTDTTGDYLATVSGTAGEITITGAAGEGVNQVISFPAAIDLGGKTSLEIPNSAAPSLSVLGQLAIDTDFWGTSGALQFRDGSGIASVPSVVSDTPTTGETVLFAGTGWQYAVMGNMLKSVYDPQNAGVITGQSGTLITGSGTTGTGGSLQMLGGNVADTGNGGTAGSISLNGGSSATTGSAGNGGSITLYGGSTVSGFGSGGIAGSITMVGGTANGDSNGGNGGAILTSGGDSSGGDIGGSGGNIHTYANGPWSGGAITTNAGAAPGGYINTADGGGSIDTSTFNAFIELGSPGNGGRTTLLRTTGADYSITFPGASGTVALTNNAIITFTNTGLRVSDTNASHYLSIVPGSDLTQNRQFTITTGDAARTLSMGGNITTASSFTTAGAFSLTLTATATTNATVPSGTVTLVDLSTAQSLSSKTIQMVNTGLRVNDTNASHYLQITPGSDLTNNRVLTLTTGDAARAWTVTGDLSISNNFSTVGGHTLALTTVGNTTATYPASGSITLVDAATSQTITNKTLGSGTVASVDLSWADGVRQIFNPNAVNAGINVGAYTGDVGSPADADLWYNSSTGALRARIAGSTQTLSGKVLHKIYITANDEEVTAGTARGYVRVPTTFTLTAVRASLYASSSSGDPTFDINENGSTVLGTKLTVDAGEKTSVTAASSPTITDSAIAADAEITVDVDLAGTGAAGAIIYLIGYE